MLSVPHRSLFLPVRETGGLDPWHTLVTLHPPKCTCKVPHTGKAWEGWATRGCVFLWKVQAKEKKATNRTLWSSSLFHDMKYASLRCSSGVLGDRLCVCVTGCGLSVSGLFQLPTPNPTLPTHFRIYNLSSQVHHLLRSTGLAGACHVTGKKKTWLYKLKVRGLRSHLHLDLRLWPGGVWVSATVWATWDPGVEWSSWAASRRCRGRMSRLTVLAPALHRSTGTVPWL